MSASVSDPVGGTVEVSAGAVLPGDNATFTAVPSSGYIFEGWYDENGSKVSGQMVYTFPAEQNTVLTARFTKRQVSGPTTVTVTPTVMTLTVGGTAQITATPSQAGVQLVWSSSDERVATVDPSGIVTAVGEGTAVITVTTNDGNTAVCTVTVNAAGQTGPTEPAGPGGSVPEQGMQTGAVQPPQAGTYQSL